MADDGGKTVTGTDRVTCQRNAFIRGKKTHSAQNRT